MKPRVFSIIHYKESLQKKKQFRISLPNGFMSSQNFRWVAVSWVPQDAIMKDKTELEEASNVVCFFNESIRNWMGPYQRTPQEVARAIRYSGLGVRSVGPVGDFLEWMNRSRPACLFLCDFFPIPTLGEKYIFWVILPKKNTVIFQEFLWGWKLFQWKSGGKVGGK